jgi:hypothetical protein
MRNTALCTLLSCAVLFGSAAARTRDRAAIPRLADHKPDLNGIWQAVAGADVNLEDHIAL